MAKGNLFLGTAANSVGDVVMYRREGAQVSRVRVRNVANPRTNAQSTQRAFFAPVAKFYSPLSTILERSFEGLNKSKSYSKFLKTNVSLARANDWLLPKGTGFFPLPYQLSQGTLPAFNFVVNEGSLVITLPSIGADEDVSTIADLSEFFISSGYQNGDIISIILIKGDPTDVESNFVPVSLQFAVDTTNTTLIGVTFRGYNLSTAAGSLSFKPNNDLVAAGAVIVARFENDKWRRSTQALAVSSSIIEGINTTAFKAAAIASYGNSATGDNPLVYLDGDELADNT